MLLWKPQGYKKKLYIRALKTPLNRGFKPSNLNNAKPLLPTPTSVSKSNVSIESNLKKDSSSYNWQKPTKFIPATMHAEKITKGLCYYYD